MIVQLVHQWSVRIARTIFVLTAILSSGLAGNAAPLRIQCVGDSITAGYTNNPTWTVPFEFGYRSSLYTQLVNTGYDVQFVGASPEPWNGVFGVPTNIPSPDLRNINGVNQDKHRGYGGYSTATVRSNIGGWLAVDNPDIVLLMVGINDGDLSAARTNLYQIVNTIVTAKPNADVIVAQITPYAFYSQALYDYNSYIRNQLVPTFQIQHKNVSTVDQYSNFLTNGSIDPTLYSNGINHPNAIGYDRMAETWADGIMAVHPVPEPSSLALLACGLFGLMAYVWRKRKYSLHGPK